MRPGATTLVGDGASAGVVQAACRVLTAETFHELRPGEVAVLVFTNSAFNAYLPRCGGVVTDSGGSLSHAAICAREAGIPAVCGCARATDVLKTGDLVLVDGSKGEVEILERAGARAAEPAS